MRNYLDQILLCDCVEGMATLPNACIPLTVTSPPYDGMRIFGGHPFEFDGIAQQLWRITMAGGVLVWVIQNQVVAGAESLTSASNVLRFSEMGFRLHQTIIMRTNAHRHPHPNRYRQQFHYAYVLSKGRPRCVNLLRDRRNSTAGAVLKKSARNPDGGICTTVYADKKVRTWGVRGTVWDYLVGYQHSTTDKDAFQAHPALMPEKMAEDHILSWSRPGDLVFDPLAGAGTTCKAALLNHRHYLGMEVHRPYWTYAVQRLQRAREEYVRRLIEGFGQVA